MFDYTQINLYIQKSWIDVVEFLTYIIYNKFSVWETIFIIIMWNLSADWFNEIECIWVIDAR